MKGADQKAALIDSAMTLFHDRGYAHTGTRDIAAAAHVPQGSFTNHFRSKETIGVAALDRYVARLSEAMQTTLADGSRPARERLLVYFDLIGDRIARAGWRRGCLIADLAAEVPAHSEVLRSRLSEVMRDQVSAFEAVVGEAIAGSDDVDLAAFIIAAWHGTLLRMKVERGPEPMQRFDRMLRRLLDG